jgi:hypothetical protein
MAVPLEAEITSSGTHGKRTLYCNCMLVEKSMVTFIEWGRIESDVGNEKSVDSGSHQQSVDD